MITLNRKAGRKLNKGMEFERTQKTAKKFSERQKRLILWNIKTQLGRQKTSPGDYIVILNKERKISQRMSLFYP